MADARGISTVVHQNAVAALGHEDIQPFSSQAFKCLNGEIETFIGELVDESTKIAKRHRSDSVSVAHVQQAAEYLTGSSHNRIFRHVGTLGGIVLGAGLSTVLSLVAANQVSMTGLLISTTFSAVGAFLVALHIARD